ncbi:MAG: hypothetical protein ACREKN_06695 [Longimicrobiaceae bacterium]
MPANPLRVFPALSGPPDSPAGRPAPERPAGSLRRRYLDWIEECIETYKEEMPRGELLDLADQVVEELRMTRRGQYQLTELLLSAAVDRKIFRLLGLPGYRVWKRELDQGGDSP